MQILIKPIGPLTFKNLPVKTVFRSGVFWYIKNFQFGNDPNAYSLDSCCPNRLPEDYIIDEVAGVLKIVNEYDIPF